MNNENNNINNGIGNPNITGPEMSNNVPQGINPMDQVVMPGQPQVSPQPQQPVGNVVGTPSVGMVAQNVAPQNPGVTPVQPQPINNPVMSQTNPASGEVNPGGYVAGNVVPEAPVGQSAPQNPQPVIPGFNPNPQPMPAFDNPNSIGTIPPVNPEPVNNKKKKKGMNKVLFVILIIVLLGAVGAGVYWYLNIPKTPDVNIDNKDLVLELNEDVPTSIEDYATISGTNVSNCTLNTESVDTTKVGQYEYTIKCGELEKKGKVFVGDTKAPVVSVITVTKKQNEELKPEEFIGLCVDSSECKYEFEDATAAATLTSTVGNDVKVSIIVKDETDNETKVEGILNVIESGIRAYYECTSKEQNLEDLNATMTLTHSLGILDTNAADGKLAFGGFGTQKFVYKFTDAEQFDKLQKEFKENGTVKINNVEGIASIDKEKLTITMISDLDLANLKTQYGEESFVSYGTLKPLYENTLGYTCKTK